MNCYLVKPNSVSKRYKTFCSMKRRDRFGDNVITTSFIFLYIIFFRNIHDELCLATTKEINTCFKSFQVPTQSSTQTPETEVVQSGSGLGHVLCFLTSNGKDLNVASQFRNTSPSQIAVNSLRCLVSPMPRFVIDRIIDD